MRLTKQTSHAIRVLIHCARSGDALLKVGEIARELDITQQNAFKIVHVLSRAGFLKAVRGRSGGVRLARAPETIRIGEVVRATETTRVEVGEGEGTGGPRILAINEALDDALAAFISVLDRHTLADMAKGLAAEPSKVRPSGRGRPAGAPAAGEHEPKRARHRPRD